MKLATLMASKKADRVLSCYERRKKPIDGVLEVEPFFPFKYLMDEDGGIPRDERNKELVQTLLYGKGKIMKNDGVLLQLVMNSLEFLESLGERNAQHIQWMLNNNPLRLTEVFLAHLNTMKEDVATDMNAHEEISKKMQTQKIEVDKKLKFAKGCKKATSVAFVAVSTIVPLIAIVIAPHLVVAILQSISALASPVSNFIWKHKEKALEGKEKVISSILDLINHVVMQDLGVIHQVEEKLQSLLPMADLVVTEQKTVEKLVELDNTIKNLLKQAKERCVNIEDARNEVIKCLLDIKEKKPFGYQCKRRIFVILKELT